MASPPRCSFTKKRDWEWSIKVHNAILKGVYEGKQASDAPSQHTHVLTLASAICHFYPCFVATKNDCKLDLGVKYVIELIKYNQVPPTLKNCLKYASRKHELGFVEKKYT